MKRETVPAPSDAHDEISALVETLLETERRLEEITLGEVDTVAGRDGRTFLLRRAQEELRRSEASRQSAILNALPAHIALLDTEGVIISVNEAWRRFADTNLLHAPGHAVGLNYLQVCDSAQGAESAVARAVAAGIRTILSGSQQNFSIEYPCHSRAEKRWFLMRVAPLSEVVPGGAVVMHINITDRKRVEDSLRLSEASMSAAQGIAHIGSWELELVDSKSSDLGGLCWSDEMFRIAGYEPGTVEIDKEFFFSLVPPEERESVRMAVTQAIRDRGRYIVVHRMIRPNGETRVIREVGRISFDEETGAPLRILGTAHDITDQRSAEEAIRKSEQEQRQLVHQLEIERARLVEAQRMAKVGSWETDLSTLEVTWSEEAHHIFKTNPKTFQPTHEGFLQLVHPDDRRRVDEAFRQSLDQHRACEIEHRVLFLDGRIKFVEERWQAWFDELGKPVRARGTCQDVTERKLAHTLLRESELRYHSLFENMVEGYAYCQTIFENGKLRDFLYVEVNGAFGKLTGLEGVEGKRVSEVLPGLYESSPDLFELYGRVALSGKLEQCETLVKSLGIWLSITVYSREKEHFVAVFDNITERKKAEVALRASEAEFRTLSEAMPQIVWMTGADGGNIYFNQHWVDYTGLSREESFGGGWITPFHPDDRERAWKALEAATTAKTVYSIESRLRRADGVYRWWLVRGVPLTDAAGTIFKWVGTCTDIDELKQVQIRVGEQAELLNATHEAILVMDLEDHIIYWNDGAVRTYGYTAQEALGQNSGKLLYRDTTRHDEAHAAVLKYGKWHGEMVKYGRDGVERTVDARWSLVRDARGVPKSILSIGSDISEKKKLEGQFLRTQRMESIGTLAGGIAHDLNNTLAPILMAVEILKESVVDERGFSLLDTLHASAQRGAELVKQVLSFARGVEGQRIIINPLHIMRELIKVLRDTFPKSVSIQFTAARGIWTVTGDPTQLHQVFLNLCVNARDAMPGGGKLTVTMENVVLDESYAAMSLQSHPGKYVMIKVEDTGTGIPLEIRDKIFEPFFTTKSISNGTGLGLSTTMAIVKGHNAFIDLCSEVGRGTTFKVYFPADSTQITVTEHAIEANPLPRGNGELILLVDDEEPIRQVAKRTLEAFGYRVLLACNGAEAVAVYAQNQPTIAAVLTDMVMPIMDGAALIVALKSMNPRVKIIGSSGLASHEAVTRVLNEGVRHFVPKPYTAETLLKILRDVLEGTTNGELPQMLPPGF